MKKNLNEQAYFSYHKKPNKSKVLSDMLKDNYAGMSRGKDEETTSNQPREFLEKPMHRGQYQSQSSSNQLTISQRNNLTTEENFNEIAYSTEQKHHFTDAQYKVGNICSWLNTKEFQAENPKMQEIFVQVLKIAQKMESRIVKLNTEIRKLDKQNKYLILTQRHKEEMLNKVLEENRRIKTEYASIEHINKNIIDKNKNITDKSVFDVLPNYHASIQHNNLNRNLRNPRPTSIITEGDETSKNKTPKGKSYSQSVNKRPMTSTYQKTRITSGVTIEQKQNLSMSNIIRDKSAKSKPHECKSKNKPAPKLVSNLLESILGQDSSLSNLLFDDEIYKMFRNVENFDESMDIVMSKFNCFNYIKTISQSQDYLKDTLNSMTPMKFTNFFDNLRLINSEIKKIFGLIIRMRTVQDNNPLKNDNYTSGMATESIIKNICCTLECEDTYIFKPNLLRGEFYILASSNKIRNISLPINKGICGWILESTKECNIKEASNDERFDISFDTLVKKKTTSILGMPVMNNIGQIECIILAVNKKPSENGVVRFFDYDDSGLVKIYCENIKEITTYETRRKSHNYFLNDLKAILHSGIYMNSIKNIAELNRVTEIKLADMFNSQESKLYLLDSTEEKIWRYDPKGKKTIYSKDSGIVGLCLNYRQIVLISNPMKDNNYNKLVDIETHLPIIAVPIICSITKKLIGVFEVINTRGFEGMSETGISNLSPRDYEILDFFSKQSAQCILSQDDYMTERDLSKGILLSKSLLYLSMTVGDEQTKKLNSYLFNNNQNDTQKLFQSSISFNKKINKSKLE